MDPESVAGDNTGQKLHRVDPDPDSGPIAQPSWLADGGRSRSSAGRHPE